MFSPRNGSRVFLIIESDLLSIDKDSMLPQLNLVREVSMGRVILKEIFEILGIHERIVNS